MTFQDAEKTYQDLKAQHAASKLSDQAFEAEVGKLRMQDAQGRWWQIGVQTGEWYMHDGQKWIKAKPPVNVGPPPIEPMATPEVASSAKSKSVATPKATPAPAPKNEPAPKGEKNSALPARLFSSKPAGRTGLPLPALIGIIAAVALVVIAIIAGVIYFLNSGAGGVATKPTTTPTRSLAVLPSPVVPTITVARPTDTPLPPPTPIVTATAATTGTVTARTPVPAGTPRATATKKPGAGTPVAVATATPTINAPPGVYVTGVKTDPGVVNIGDTVAFKVTFLNTTGQMQTYKWMVKVYSCPEQCQGDTAFKTSYGESLKVDSNMATGAVELTNPKHVNFGTGRCNYIAIPHYIDQTNQQVIPFKSLKSNAFYYEFSVCH